MIKLNWIMFGNTRVIIVGLNWIMFGNTRVIIVGHESN